MIVLYLPIALFANLVDADVIKLPLGLAVVLIGIYTLIEWRRISPGEPLPIPDGPDESAPSAEPPHGWRKVREQIGRVSAAVFPRAAAVIIGAAMALATTSLMSLARTSWLASCAAPVELRVMVPPEGLRAVQQTAQDFTADQADDGCRPVHVNVFPAPAMEDIRDAFRQGWTNPAPGQTTSALSDVGPQPDVWLAATSAEVTYGTGLALSGVTVQADPTPVASSPLVLAALPAAATRLGEDPGTWDQLVERARDKGISLLRADPDSADTGTYATLGLYGGHAANTADDEAIRRARELSVLNSEAPVTSAGALLCWLRDKSAENPQLLSAALVPEQAMDDYNAGAPLGGSCTQQAPAAGGEGAAATLLAYYPQDTRTLDYRFVRISWKGQRDEQRDRLVDEFRTWLGTERLTLEGFRTPVGGPGDRGRLLENNGVRKNLDRPLPSVKQAELSATRLQIKAAREPISVLFAVDRSGTMDAPTAAGTAFGTARAFTNDALRFLGERDSAGLWVFPEDRSGRTPQRLVSMASADGEHVAGVRQGLGSVTADGWITPLYNSIVAGVRGLPPDAENRTLIVVTDGVGDDDPGHNPTRGIEAVKTELRRPTSPRVFVISVGESGCGAQLRALEKILPRLSCLDLAGSGDLDELLTDLFVKIWSG